MSRQHHFNTLHELVFDICSRESADAAGRVAVLLWQIWSAINVVWNDTHDESSITIGGLAVNGWPQWNQVRLCRSRAIHNYASAI